MTEQILGQQIVESYNVINAAQQQAEAELVSDAIAAIEMTTQLFA